MMFDIRSFFRHHLGRDVSRSKRLVCNHDRAKELVFKSHPFHFTGKVFRVGLGFGEFIHCIGYELIVEGCITAFEFTSFLILAHHHIPIKIYCGGRRREYMFHIMSNYLTFSHILIIRDSIYKVEIRRGICNKTHGNHLSLISNFYFRHEEERLCIQNTIAISKEGKIEVSLFRVKEHHRQRIVSEVIINFCSHYSTATRRESKSNFTIIDIKSIIFAHSSRSELSVNSFNFGGVGSTLNDSERVGNFAFAFEAKFCKACSLLYGGNRIALMLCAFELFLARSVKPSKAE